MADSQSKRRNYDQIRSTSSSGRFFKRRRGAWGHSRGSISAALAITTTAPPAANGGVDTGESTTKTTTSQLPAGPNGGGAEIGSCQQQQNVPKQRHGRKRRRHRNSSFSGDKGSSSMYSLPPAVAAALAIPPKTPESQDVPEPNPAEGDEKKSIEDLHHVLPQNGHNVPISTASTASVAGTAPSNAGATSGKKKKRRTRRKRRQWKPYYKLTAEERRELEEREEKRAERIRAKRFAHGQPVAPYNTTQFLLHDRELRNAGEPDCGDLDEIVRNIRHHTRSGSYESPGAAAAAASDSDVGDASSDNSDYSYLEREFDNDWLDEQRQRLETMTKDELVKEFMDLQKQYESAQRDMRMKRLSYEQQLLELRRENESLRLRGVSSRDDENGQHEEDRNRWKDDAGGSGSVSGSMDDVNYSSSSSASTNEASHSNSSRNETG